MAPISGRLPGTGYWDVSGMLQALQAMLLSQDRARGAKSCAATVAVAVVVAFSLRSKR